MFCQRCQDVANAGSQEAEKHSEQAYSSSSSPVMVHHPDWTSFEDAVSAGCHLCNLIHEGLVTDEFLTDVAPRPTRIYWQAHTSSSTPRAYLIFSPSIACRTGVTFYLIRAEDDESTAPLQEPESAEERALASTRIWLDDCLANHADYCGKGTGGFVPTRLLDVGRAGDSDIRLCTSVPSHEKYATLSHCWGKSQILTLRLANLASFRSGIRVDSLPKTFRDAIVFLRRLGLRYLWIDSLCIIQDSADDWRKESVTMAEVYRNGVINVAATAASGGDDGLYFPVDEFHSKHLKVTFTRDIMSIGSTGGSDGTSPPVVPSETYYLLNGKVWQHGVDKAPLNTRGWVLQERLFSPRIVHFSRHQLFWQCGMDYRIGQFARSNMRMEVFGKAYTNRDLRAFAQVLWRMRTMPKEQKDWFVLDEAYLPWEEIVTTYTGQHLTKGEDKLIAVQALAGAMEAAVDDRYVAGLWESRLVEDLLWACSPASEQVKYSRQEAWRAPSWSWASVDGASVKKATLAGRYVGRKAFEGESLVGKIDHFVEGFDGVTTGQLKSARLRLEGRPLSSTIPWGAEGALNDGHVKGIGMRAIDARIRYLIICPDEWDWNANDEANYQVPSCTVFLPIGTHPAYRANGTDPAPCIEGLLLKEVDKPATLTFRRIGYFKLVAEPDLIESYLQGEGGLLVRHKEVSASGFCTLNLL